MIQIKVAVWFWHQTKMMRYFFHVGLPSGELRDEDGLELLGPEAALAYAECLAWELAHETATGNDTGALCIRVTDAVGSDCFRLGVPAQTPRPH